MRYHSLLRYLVIKIITLLSVNAKAQDSGIKPQYWANVGASFLINERFLISNIVSYNVLINKEFPWSEITNNSSTIFRAKPFLFLSGGIYIAYTKQSKNLSSFD